MRATWIVLLMSPCLGLTASPVGAEFIGLDIGASQWARSTGVDEGSIDLVDDLDVEDPSQSSMVLILEHPIKALPNVKYRGYDLRSIDTSAPVSEVSLDGQAISPNSAVTSSLDLSQDDIVLYYQLADERFDLDLGVDLKRFAGELSLSGPGSTSYDVDETIPLLYLSARYDLPNSGFYVGANINANIIDLGLSDSDAQDSTIMMGYQTRSGLGLEGGIKYFSLELDDVNNVDTDVEYDGIYFNGYINF